MKIYKYDLGFGRIDLELPQGAEILHFNMQRNVPRLWALVDPQAPTETRRFVLYGTGHEILETREELTFIGTALMMEGTFIWHVFEVHSLESTIIEEEENES